MKPASAAGRGSGAPLPPPVAALFGYRPETVPMRLAVRLFGPELVQPPAALSAGLARWLQAPGPCVETCTRGGCQLTLQVHPLIKLPPKRSIDPALPVRRGAGEVAGGAKHRHCAPAVGARPLRHDLHLRRLSAYTAATALNNLP